MGKQNTQEVTLDGVTLQPWKHAAHTPGSVSAKGFCAEGGRDTCKRVPLFSVTSDRFNIAACEVHVFGALERAHTMSVKLTV